MTEQAANPTLAKNVKKPTRSIETIYKSIRNSIANLIRYRFNHNNAVKTKKSEQVRTCKRTIHTLGDIVIHVFEELIKKMLNVTKSNKKVTIDMGTFITSAKLLPSTSTLASHHNTWNKTIDDVSDEANKLVEEWKTFQNESKEGQSSEKATLNKFMEDKSYFVRPMSICALIRARLPSHGRLGGGRLLAIALSIFGSTVAELVLHGAAENMEKKEKIESLAPRHLFPAIEDNDVIKFIMGNAVVVGTPIGHRPDVVRRGKQRRKHTERIFVISEEGKEESESGSEVEESEEEPPKKRHHHHSKK